MRFHTFDEMCEVLAEETPHALVLDWWRRMEDALVYYTVEHYGQRFRRAADAIARLELDTRVEPAMITALHSLRRIRNRIAHGPCFWIAPEDATLYAAAVLHFIGLLPNRRS